MRLLPIPITNEALQASAPYWLPFIPKLVRRSKETIATFIDRIVSKEVRLVMVWDDETQTAVALFGVRIVQRGNDLIGEPVWCAGAGPKVWEHLFPDFEQLLRDAGCVECRPLMRYGLVKTFKRAGYKITHVQMEKSLA